jgi:prepilin-type N-terminal cleavage/methylation domain-containing protein
MRRQAGFTLLEVMIAMLIGSIGLMGTIAVQSSIINASKNANDAAVALRLASQKLEELSSRNTDTQWADNAPFGLAALATFAGWRPYDQANNSVPEFVDVQGHRCSDSGGFPISPTNAQRSIYRWRRQWQVVNTGNGLPYVISVIVTYNNDSGDPKTTRLDLERRKSW